MFSLGKIPQALVSLCCHFEKMARYGKDVHVSFSPLNGSISWQETLYPRQE